MPFNLIKTYSDLLELGQYTEPQRKASLMSIFKRDIENNSDLKFLSKQIRPITKDDGESAMSTLYHHLTTKEDEDAKGKKLGKRSFEMARSVRLHWIRHHIDGKKTSNFVIFSFIDRVSGKNHIRTYLYDLDQEYVIILEPQRSGKEYYLLTAYHLNEPFGKKQIEKKMKNKLNEIH